RLDQEPDARSAELLGGEAQVRHERRAELLRIGIRRRDARQAVDLRAAERLRVVDRLADTVLKLADALRVAGEAAAAARRVAGRQVVQHLRELVPREPLGELLLGIGVR